MVIDIVPTLHPVSFKIIIQWQLPMLYIPLKNSNYPKLTLPTVMLVAMEEGHTSVILTPVLFSNVRSICRASWSPIAVHLLDE